MGTVDRYLLREITLPFGVGLLLFFAVVSFAQVLKVSDSVTGFGVTGPELVWALLYSLPPLLGLLIPASGLFATLLGVGRLAADREVLGLCSGGMSPYALLRVPSCVGLVLALFSGAAAVVGEPWGVRGLRALMQQSAQRAMARGVRAGEFNEWVPGVTFLAAGREGRELTDVVFADRRDSQNPIVISARRGNIEHGKTAGDLVFHLRDGRILVRDEPSGSTRVLHFHSSRYLLDVGRIVRRKARTISSMQAKDLATLWKESRDPTAGDGHRAHATIALHRKLAIPLATLIFALLAVPLACQSSGGARARGFLISAALVGAYYYVGRAAELSARGRGFDPVLAAWLPDLLGVLALGIVLVRFRRSAV